MKYVKIYLIRHGRQDSGLCNVDVSLSKEGRQQAHLVGQRLKNYGINRVYSSNLVRAVETAGIIREELGFEERGNQQFPELRETDFGDMTGLSDDVLKIRFADYFSAREAGLSDLRIPGGENGKEVFERMYKKIDDIVKEIIEEAAKDSDIQSSKDKQIVIVSHGGAIRCYLAGLLSMPFGKRFAIAKTMENTSITQVNYNLAHDNYTVEMINDYSHLAGHEELLREYFKPAF